MGKQWFVATTKHQQEIRAAKELRDQMYRVWLPPRHHQARIGQHIEVVTTLRFPGYIFIEFDLAAQEHGPINNTRAVGELIPPGEKPTPIIYRVPGQPNATSQQWELEMRRHVEEEWEIATGKAKPDPRADLHHGDIVMIDRRGHAMHGREGEYSRTENGEAIIQVELGFVRIPEIDVKLVRQRGRIAA